MSSEVEPRLETRRTHCKEFRKITCTFRVNTVINIVLEDNLMCMNSSQFCCCCCFIRKISDQWLLHGIISWLSRRALFPLCSFLSFQLFSGDARNIGFSQTEQAYNFEYCISHTEHGYFHFPCTEHGTILHVMLLLNVNTVINILLAYNRSEFITVLMLSFCS